ncbi:MAG: DUF5107 domain-containing protein [bacterium]
MNRLYSLFKFHIVPIVLILLFISCGTLYSQVTQRDTIITWKHFNYQLSEDNGMDWYSTTEIIEEEYPGIVLENEWVRLVILPDYGARILSFVYKPTGHEQFYINPVGAPYGIYEGNFYYDWLMVFGGVFPTFPEPEHGKTWLLPWDWEFIEIGPARISLKMEIQDTINYPGHPWKFDNGITGIRCTSTVILESGSTSFKLQHTLENTKAQLVSFEYWTCTTLAPGSDPGNTFTPANSEIIAPIEYVYLKDDWWSWMGNSENPAPQQGNHVFTYDNLALYENWEDMGIAYAHPKLEESYYGVVNHTNEEAVFRVSDNATTPGMKFWTWGAQQGLNSDPENFYDNARPYIELWSGLSTQFFEDASLAPLETVSWTETYLPTVGMDAYSTVNENGALSLEIMAGDDERFESTLFMNRPDSSFNYRLTLSGDAILTLFDSDFLAESENSTQFTHLISDFAIPDGDYMLEATVSEPSGNELITFSTPVTLPIPASGIPGQRIDMPLVIRHDAHSYSLQFSTPSSRSLFVYHINGQLIDQRQTHGSIARIRVETAGYYVVYVVEENRAFPVKIRCW